MTIKTDSKGFLIADGPIDTATMARGIDAVHSDTSAILSLLRGGARSASVMKRQRVSSPPQAVTAAVQRATSGAVASAVRSALAQSRSRDAQGRFLPNAPGELTGITRAVNALTRRQGNEKAQQKRTEAAVTAASVKAVEQVRDKSGRFVGRGGSRREGGSDGGGDSALRNMFSRLKDLSFPRLHGPDLGDYEKIDPTVEAAKEVSKVVGGPLATVGKLTKAGASRAFGIGKDTSLPWFRKIFGVLKSTHDEQSEFGLVQTRTLKEIDNKTGGEHGAGGGGMLGGIGDLLKGALGKGGGLLSSLMGGAMKFGKFGLKRLPLLGALFAGGSALASIFGGDDPNKTAEQNKQDRFTGAGSGIGALIGGGVGTLLGGPVGTVIGGMIGDKLGEIVGGWLATVDWAKVGAQISDTWSSTVGALKDDWKAVTDKLASISKTIGEAWDSILSGAKAFLKDKFGIDVDALVGKAKDAVAPAVDAAKQAAAPVVDAGKAAVDYGKDRVEKMAAPIQTATSNALDWGKGLFGKGSKGNKLALMSAADKAGITDPNERAMFMAQMDTESGGFRSLEENLNYKPKTLRKVFGKYFKTDAEAQAAADGGPEAIANKVYGGRMGNTDAGDGYKFRGRGFVQLTGKDNYAAAGKALGIDLVAHPELAADPSIAAQISTWYWKSKGGLADAARAGDVTAATKKINGGLNGLAQRDEKYKAYLASGTATPTLNAGSVVPPVTAVASAFGTGVPGAVSVPSMPSPASPPPAQTAQIPVPVNSDKPMEVRLTDDRGVGQDLQNRRLAQIATGGVAGQG